MSFLISFEGIDGCGKSTQINLLKNELENRDISSCILREPGDTSISDKIREILLDKENNICAESETLLFLAARAQLVREKILPELEKGSLVICDRYYDSTLAYQGYGRNLDRSLINNLNKFDAHNNLIFTCNKFANDNEIDIYNICIGKPSSKTKFDLKKIFENLI